MRNSLLIPSLLFLTASALAQTRIEPPSVEFSSSPSNAPDRDNMRSIYTDVTVPIPKSAGIAMPFLSWRERDIESISVEDQNRSVAIDRRVTLGLLHHPAEGAPEWKVELGRQGSFTTRGHLIGSANYNLEKRFPFLRPDNSDKLDSWIGMSAIAGNNSHIFAMPELGWTWRDIGTGIVIEAVAPHVLRIGYHEEKWTATIGAKQNWIVVDNPESHAGFYVKPQRLFLIEATRDLQSDFFATFSGGVEIHDVYGPYVGLGFGWLPRN